MMFVFVLGGRRVVPVRCEVHDRCRLLILGALRAELLRVRYRSGNRRSDLQRNDPQ